MRLAGVKVARRHADTVSRGGQRLVTLAGDSTVQYTVHSTAPSSVMISVVGGSVNTPHPHHSCSSKQSKHSNQLILALDQISYNNCSTITPENEPIIFCFVCTVVNLGWRCSNPK